MPSPIQTVIIKVINECNLRCTYCFVEPSVPRKVMITETIVRQLLDELEKYSAESTIHLVWHGGEPTLAQPTFFRRMKELQAGRSIKFVNLIQTNGTLLTDSYVSVLKHLDFHIGLSLDGPESLNDRARIDKKGHGSFAKIQHAIEILRKYKMPFGVLATIAQHNINDADKLYTFCKDHGVSLKLSPLYHSGKATCNIDSLAISIDEYTVFTNQLAKLWLEDDDPVKIDPIEPLLVNVLGGSAAIGCAFSKNCHHNILAIGPTGDLYPCGMFQGFPEFSYGNILTTSLNDVVSSNVFRRMDNRSNAIAETCSPCSIREKCNGGCPFHSMVNIGFLNEKTPLCQPYKNSITTILDVISKRLHHSL
ncbi:radical SAM/SPASM domain-containing protein [Thiothrix subterranea]|uniref:Radical SAM protein n=1 Tax=Thiothrix subterranea TaxID=2735563 RepID=A0AA51R1C2_9GAMM|nr:radical SAM protein [Thiothrix subterranea]MDQ5767937.1 radical SAM protein [Thiothrix subterranea]WML86604.1 radical SAM protein [Thiothrix subterranea]